MLADGGRPAPVPATITAAVKVPVIGARVFGPGDTPSAGCVIPRDPALGSARSLGAVVTPDGLSEGVVGGTPRQLETCEARRQQGRWVSCGASHANWPNDAALSTNGGGTAMCVGQTSEIAFGWVASPAATAWVLQDRGSYMLAYPVVAGNPTRVSANHLTAAPTPGFSAHLVYLDANGNKVGEQTVNFYVAG